MCLFRLTKLVYENYNYNITNIIQKYNMKKNIFRDIFIVFLLTIIFSSCINIKSELPKISLYRLKQESTQGTNAAAVIIDKSIFIENFASNMTLASEKIVVIENEVNLKKYDYHQWTIPLDEMMTDFTIDRINRYKSFKKGVVNSVSMLPDLILEARIVSCNINNSNNKKSPNTVELVISANISSSQKTKPGFTPIFSEVYTKTIARPDNTLNSAVTALSKSLSDIVDNILVDIDKKLKENVK